MNTLTVQATKWSRLNDAEDVDGISPADADCLHAIQSVLQQYHALDRFGINLLHRHFALQDDEILLETTDEHTRLQTVRPVKRDAATGAMKVTAFRFADGDALGRAALYCRGGGKC